MQRQVDLAAVPGVTQFIRRDRDRRECGPGLGLVETELLGQLCRYQVPERYVIDDSNQLDMFLCLLGGDAGGHIVGKDSDLGFKIDTPVFTFHQDVIAGADKRIGGAHVHQWIDPEGFGQFRPAGLAHHFNVGNVGAAVGPVVGAGQGRGKLLRVEVEGVLNVTLLELVKDLYQGRFRFRPVIQRGLHGRRDLRHFDRLAHVTINNHQGAVAPPFFKTGQFHRSISSPN